MNKKPIRKNIRLQGYDYSQAGYYFITICVSDKRPLLSKIKPNRVETRVGTDVPVCPQYKIDLLPMGIEAKKQYNI